MPDGIDHRVSQTKRGHQRKEQIIAAATDLFDRCGYHATGIDDIGEAAGITGPGIYRHFASKDDILMEVFDRIWLILRDSIDAARDLPPDQALDLMVRTHVDLVVEHRVATTLFLRELQSLPEEYRAKVRRNDVRYLEAWAQAIIGCNEGLSSDQARVVARSCFWAINAYDADQTSSRLAQPLAKEMLTSIAHAVLNAV